MKSSMVVAFTFFVALAVFAQDHPTVAAQTNTIYVGADGKFEAAPDTARLQFNISVQDNTAQAAFERASGEVEDVRQVLRVNGIAPKQATIGFMSVQPVYDWKNPTRKILGYRVITDVTLDMKDFSKIAPVTQQLANANVSENQTLSYILQNMDEAKDKAVEDAYRRAHDSADTLAHASGRVLGDLSYASIDVYEAPRPILPRAMHAMTAMGNAATPAPTEEFTPQNVTVTAHVNALFNLK
jgi:uncharacterized protein YggE